MLKIVYPICCGLDVHKSFVFACVVATNEKGVTIYQSKRFSTFTRGLRELSDWLARLNCKDVCMESTGKYWIPVWNILEPTCKLVIAHPKYVKERKPIKKMPSGLPTSLSTTSSPEALSHPPTSANYTMGFRQYRTLLCMASSSVPQMPYM